MNPYSGHVVQLDSEAFRRALGERYERLPDELQAEAAKVLDGKTEAHVNLRKRSPLADWAKKKRKAKIAAKSRRANRR